MTLIHFSGSFPVTLCVFVPLVCARVVHHEKCAACASRARPAAGPAKERGRRNARWHGLDHGARIRFRHGFGCRPQVRSVMKKAIRRGTFVWEVDKSAGRLICTVPGTFFVFVCFSKKQECWARLDFLLQKTCVSLMNIFRTTAPGFVLFSCVFFCKYQSSFLGTSYYFSLDFFFVTSVLCCTYR